MIGIGTHWRRFADSLAPDDEVSDERLEQGLRWLLRNGIGGQAMETLSTGALLVAYALQLGASNLTIGLLAALPHLAQFAQLPGVWLVERLRRRRFIAVIVGAASRPMYLGMAAAAFLASEQAALWLLAVAFALRYALGGLLACAWNAWMRDLVPEGRMGRYFGQRLMVMTAAGALLSLAAAGFVDLWRFLQPAPEKYAYAVLLLGAFVAGSISVWCMTKMPEPRMLAPEAREPLLRQLAGPLKDDNFRRLMWFLAAWNFAVNLAAPFFAVHMLQRLGLDVTLVILLTILSQAANVLVMRQWGQIADRMSNKAVLAVCSPLFVACIFAWIFTTNPEPHEWTLPLLVAIHIVTGVATAGVTLASGNIGLKLAPRGNATAYLAALSLANAVAAGIAPIVGGLCADFFNERQLALILQWTAPLDTLTFRTLDVRQWDFFFLIATAVGLYSIHRLREVHETGEVHERIVIAEMLLLAKRSVRNLSSIAGLRSGTEFPLDVLRLRRRRRRPPAPGDAPPSVPPDEPPQPP